MRLETTYATALHEASRAPGADGAALVRGLVSTAARRGHTRLLPRILAAYEALCARDARRAPSVVAAREEDVASARAAAQKEFGGAMGDVLIDRQLVSGFILSDGNRRVDRSGRRALVNLYQRLIATAL